MTTSWFRGLSGARRNKQTGQALVYGLGVMSVVLGGLFFLFNTGQLLQEKTKLLNTADAAAYAGGVMHARALNFNAYNNRALVANEVLVAQLVSISSWSLYARNATRAVPARFPGCQSPQGAAVYAFHAFGRYELSCVFVTLSRAGIDQAMQGIQALASPLLTAVESSKSVIKTAMAQVHAPGLGLVQARNQVLKEVVDASYENDGYVRIEPNGALPGQVFQLTDQWSAFTQHYTGSDRWRMANLARAAAYADRFVPVREWQESSILFAECGFPSRRNFVNRVGGTRLIGLDEWRASDSLTYTEYRWRRWRCRTRDSNLGVGRTNARHGGSAYSAGFTSRTWNQYTGIPAFYDLRVLDQTNPTLKFTVKLIRDANQLKTGDGRSDIRAVSDGNELNPNRFLTRLKGNRMQAMSASEVFFERPVASPNARGEELASLFNPFWQVRLIQPDAAEVTAHAQAQ